MKGTRLFDVKERQRLLEGNKAAVEASKDPMILLARRVDAQARECASATRTRWSRC